MNKNSKILAISIDGVIRDLFEQFDTIYRKKFIKNPGIVGMNDKFEVVEEEEEEEAYRLLEVKINSLIHLPITTYSLRNHYEFDSKDVFEKFLYNDNALEIFGSAPQIPFSMEKANKINISKKEIGFDDVVLFCPGENQVITATFHFLTRNGCKIPHIIFNNNPLEIWNYANCVITDNPDILDSKTEEQISIKISKEYNTNSKSDLELNSLKDLELFSLEKLIKKISN